MLDWWEKNFATLELGDRRLNERAMSIGYALSLGFGKALSEVFNSGARYLTKWNFTWWQCLSYWFAHSLGITRGAVNDKMRAISRFCCTLVGLGNEIAFPTSDSLTQ